MYNYTYLCAYQILMIAILTKWLPFYKKNEFCKAPRSKATSHHTNVPASLVPGECSHCGNDHTLYCRSQECSSTSQPRPNSSSDLRPAIIHSSKTDPVEVARHIWRRQTGGDVRGGGLHIEMTALKTLGD